MILEGLVTTRDPSGRVHTSPLGPIVRGDVRSPHELILRPYRGGRTFEHLRRRRAGVFHVVDDAELLARAAVGAVDPPVRPAVDVDGYVLEDACRAFEFRVIAIDESDERTVMRAEVVRTVDLRPFCGWNRARHAVIEAAILATRAHLLPRDEIDARFASLDVLVEKTGEAAERRAMAILREHVAAIDSRSEESPRDAVRVAAGARLHFGLIAPAPPTGDRARAYGGAGLMLTELGVEVTARTSDEWRAEGALAERALACARRYSRGSTPLDLTVHCAYEGHVGLGTGTQLSLAVARAVDLLAGRSWNALDAARRLGRGARSAVGIHGFDRGGFILDGGKRGDEDIGSLIGHYAVPESWRILVAIPRGSAGVSGVAEEAAFRQLAPPARAAEELSRLLLLGVVPGLVDADAQAFGEALYAYGKRAGELFSPVQGSAFASEEVAAIVEFLRARGICGAGQSSWGPAAFGITDDPGRAEAVARELQDRLPLRPEDVTVAGAANRGARAEWLRPSLHTLA